MTTRKQSSPGSDARSQETISVNVTTSQAVKLTVLAIVIIGALVVAIRILAVKKGATGMYSKAEAIRKMHCLPPGSLEGDSLSPRDITSGCEPAENVGGLVLVDEYGTVRVNKGNRSSLGVETADNNPLVLITSVRMYRTYLQLLLPEVQIKVDDTEESRLTADSSTVIQVNPSSAIPRVQELREWLAVQPGKQDRTRPYARSAYHASENPRPLNSSRYTDEQDMEIFRFISNEAAMKISEGRGKKVPVRGNKIWEKAVEQGVAAPHPAQSLRTRWDRNIANRVAEFSERLAEERQKAAATEMTIVVVVVVGHFVVAVVVVGHFVVVVVVVGHFVVVVVVVGHFVVVVVVVGHFVVVVVVVGHF
ncbi:hypothetical protein FOZ63_026302, partial [Perkinsus olseni]